MATDDAVAVVATGDVSDDRLPLAPEHIFGGDDVSSLSFSLLPDANAEKSGKGRVILLLQSAAIDANNDPMGWLRVGRKKADATRNVPVLLRVLRPTYQRQDINAAR